MSDRAEEIARDAVIDIIADLSDRRGLRHEWEQIDEDIQEEIRNVWIELIAARIRGGETDKEA